MTGGVLLAPCPAAGCWSPARPALIGQLWGFDVSRSSAFRLERHGQLVCAHWGKPAGRYRKDAGERQIDYLPTFAMSANSRKAFTARKSSNVFMMSSAMKGTGVRDWANSW